MNGSDNDRSLSSPQRLPDPEAEGALPEATGGATTAVLNVERLESQVASLRTEYASATPFPHHVFEDFLPQSVIDEAIKEFPALDTEQWNNYIHVNERKYSNTDPSTWGPTLRAILETLNSPEFVKFVGELTGIDGLIPDPSLEGGGLHQSPAGGFLNIHADFTVHPHHRNWQRRANLLLYLNDDWKPEYGGDLELWTKDMKHCAKKVAPIANQALIFTTDFDSFHGLPDPITCPEGEARRSLALYYFTIEDSPLPRSTEYRGRPGDGLHGIAIYLDKQILRSYDWAKRRLGLSDDFARKVLGLTDRIRRKGPPAS